MTRKLSFFVVILLLHSLVCSEANLGYDHRAHSVAGHDKVLYDLNDSGSVSVDLDGSGSHSHFFDQGPPVRSGVVTKYRWTDKATEKVLCKEQLCSVEFKVGVTVVVLRIWDNTGDSSTSEMKIKILPGKNAKDPPEIHELSPEKGPSSGMNLVTIRGKNLYHDSKVYFGKQLALNVKHINLETIVCTAPENSNGWKYVRVVSSKGDSNFKRYIYQLPSAIPIKFEKKYWKKKDGTRWGVDQVTGITIGWDHRYYLVTRPGYVTGATVNKDLVVEDYCTGAYAGNGRAIGDIAYNPADPIKRLFISTNTYYWNGTDEGWDNGKIETVHVKDNGCPEKGDVIVSGLPVSNHDHGVNKIIFTNTGLMLISIGSTTNAGVHGPEDVIGGIPESPFSSAIILAPYLWPEFNGKVKYNQYKDPGTANVVAGDIYLYAVGFRNCFGMVSHTNGKIYATDNGPNSGFGKVSTSCDTYNEEVESRDKLVLVKLGHFYGHPNRNRGRWHKLQCSYKAPWEPSMRGYQKPLGLMDSSTNGIIEYRANSFQGALREDLFMSKVAFGEQKGVLWRAELSEDGTNLESGPYIFKEESGLSMVMGLWGEIVMPQLEKSCVLAYKPIEETPITVSMLSVHPSRGPKNGGTELFVTGYHLNHTDVQILLGGEPCTGIRDVHFESLKCSTPPGDGKVSVVVKHQEVESATFGFDFEYV